MILLWNVPWTNHPCCCTLRFDDSHSSLRQFYLSSVPNDRCWNTKFTDKKMLLLGLVLAESALGQPVRPVLKETESPSSSLNWNSYDKFEIWQRASQPSSWRCIQRDELIERIRDSSKSQSFADAVEYCFENPDLACKDTAALDELTVNVLKV